MVYSLIIYLYSNTISLGIFPDNLKYADVSPALKKGDRFDKSNYWPNSVLPVITKIFERLLFY